MVVVFEFKSGKLPLKAFPDKSLKWNVNNRKWGLLTSRLGQKGDSSLEFGNQDHCWPGSLQFSQNPF